MKYDAENSGLLYFVYLGYLDPVSPNHPVTQLPVKLREPDHMKYCKKIKKQGAMELE